MFSSKQDSLVLEEAFSWGNGDWEDKEEILFWCPLYFLEKVFRTKISLYLYQCKAASSLASEGTQIWNPESINMRYVLGYQVVY